MKISINDEVCTKEGLQIEDLLAVLLVRTGADIPKLFQSLTDRKILVKDMFGNYLVTQHWDDVVCSVMLDSDKDRQPEDRLEALALELASIFPKEKKEGTCYYFRGNKKDNVLRLKKFFKLYGNKYTDEQILNAAKSYVASFNGNYSYMRILKYFIWKDAVKTDSEGKKYIEETSDLASWIENEGQTGTGDWTSSLV